MPKIIKNNKKSLIICLPKRVCTLCGWRKGDETSVYQKTKDVFLIKNISLMLREDYVEESEGDSEAERLEEEEDLVKDRIDKQEEDSERDFPEDEIEEVPEDYQTGTEVLKEFQSKGIK